MYCNSGGCIHPGRSLVGRAGFMIMIPISSLIILSLTCSRSLIFKRHGRKIRVTSKICFRHEIRNCLRPHFSAHKPTTQQLTYATHAHYPHHHDVLHYYPWINHPCLPLYCLPCLSRVERHGLQIAISQQIAIANTQEAS